MLDPLHHTRDPSVPYDRDDRGRYMAVARASITLVVSRPARSSLELQAHPDGQALLFVSRVLFCFGFYETVLI